MIKVTFLINDKNSWIKKFIKLNNLNFRKKYKFLFAFNHNKIKGQDIVFVLSYTKILSNNFLKKNKLNLVVHSSKLPKDKGFAPMSYQVLRGKNKIYNTMFKINENIDGGKICLRNFFLLNGSELYEEIREIQGKSINDLITIFLKKFPNIIFREQKGKSNFNKRRKQDDSELNINKSIKSQINLLRICDNKKFPAFFLFKGKKYFINIKRNNNEQYD